MRPSTASRATMLAPGTQDQAAGVRALNLSIHTRMRWLDGAYEEHIEQPERKPRLHRRLTMRDLVRHLRHRAHNGWREGEEESAFLHGRAADEFDHLPRRHRRVLPRPPQRADHLCIADGRIRFWWPASSHGALVQRGRRQWRISACWSAILHGFTPGWSAFVVDHAGTSGGVPDPEPPGPAAALRPPPAMA
jgi:hypothetical protein